MFSALPGNSTSKTVYFRKHPVTTRALKAVSCSRALICTRPFSTLSCSVQQALSEQSKQLSTEHFPFDNRNKRVTFLFFPRDVFYFFFPCSFLKSSRNNLERLGEVMTTMESLANGVSKKKFYIVSTFNCYCWTSITILQVL